MTDDEKQTGHGQEPAPDATFAAKLSHLLEQARAAAGPLSYKTIAAGITERGGPQMSAAYIQQLATGRRDNPKISYVQALAEYFDVPVTYFFRTADGTRTDSDARVMAMRAESLSDEGRKQVMGLLDYVWRYEQSRRPDRQPDQPHEPDQQPGRQPESRHQGEPDRRAEHQPDRPGSRYPRPRTGPE